jgi:ectoine hydroxylase-related dioxygenase (phytanoyl-CoA dioxygenase family)
VKRQTADMHGQGVSALPEEIYRECVLAPEQISFFRENGYIHLKAVLSEQVLQRYRAEIVAKVQELSTETLPLDRRTTYGKAFLQVMNLWRSSGAVRNFVFGRRLARIAADLMESSGVRLYHDQALFKEPGGGITPWHADQYYWPFSSDRAITAWIPLTEVDLSMGPLSFCPRSHRLYDGRDLAISDESEGTLKRKLERYGMIEEPFAAGDVSFHSGWTFHRAGANASPSMREAFTIIYMDRGMRLREPTNQNQVNDRAWWCPGVQVGETIASQLNPELYPDGFGEAEDRTRREAV